MRRIISRSTATPISATSKGETSSAPQYPSAGDHELMPNIFVGQAHPPKSGPDDVFTVEALVPGEAAAGSVADTGCKMVQPT